MSTKNWRFSGSMLRWERDGEGKILSHFLTVHSDYIHAYPSNPVSFPLVLVKYTRIPWNPYWIPLNHHHSFLQCIPLNCIPWKFPWHIYHEHPWTIVNHRDFPSFSHEFPWILPTSPQEEMLVDYGLVWLPRLKWSLHLLKRICFSMKNGDLMVTNYY